MLGVVRSRFRAGVATLQAMSAVTEFGSCRPSRSVHKTGNSSFRFEGEKDRKSPKVIENKRSVHILFGNLLGGDAHFDQIRRPFPCPRFPPRAA
jgi:hypothetical protein